MDSTIVPADGNHRVGGEADADRRRLMRSAGLLMLGCAASGLLAGCGSGGSGASGGGSATIPEAMKPLVTAAQKEGKLTLYTGSEESIVAELGKAFQALYGIQLEYQRLNSSEIAMRYTAEAQAGKTVADLILTGDHEIFETFTNKGWIGKPDPATIPGLPAWPSAYKDAFSTIVSVIPYSIAINTDLVKETPKDWKFLADPSLKGAFVTLDVKRVNLVAIAAWDLMLKLYGEDFLRKIGQQQLRLVDSQPSEAQQVASGAAKVYFPASATQAQAMIAQGAPIKTVLPAGLPCTGVMSQVAMSAHAPHPNAARLFLSFLMSAAGQKILNVVAASPVNAPGAPPLPKGFVKPDFASTAANRDKIARLLGM